MVKIFDGKEFAAKRRKELKNKVSDLVSKGINPKLVTILIGNEKGGALYTKLKKEAAESVGISFEVASLGEDSDLSEVIELIKKNNQDKSVFGLMMQMPLPQALRPYNSKIVEYIEPKKDVDGLTRDSDFLHPTSRAVVEIITNFDRNTSHTCVVVGAGGMVGRPLVSRLKAIGYHVIECNSKTLDLKKETLKADILVSATGKPNLITEDMVKNGAIIIDVGYPAGDVTQEAKNKAVFATPVPGGVGPVTITCLLENLVEACYNSLS